MDQRNEGNGQGGPPKQDPIFWYIAGYTPDGLPYGITWEELGVAPYAPEEEIQAAYRRLEEQNSKRHEMGIDREAAGGRPLRSGRDGRLAHLDLSIKDIVNVMQEVDDNWNAYLNMNTGKIYVISSEYQYLAQTMGMDEIRLHYTAWEQELILEALDIEEHPDEYLTLPSRDDFDEYEVMKAFMSECCDPRQQELLSGEIRGRGAFRRFKDKLYELGIETRWFSYRDQALYRMAQNWCGIHGIRYEDF